MVHFSRHLFAGFSRDHSKVSSNKRENYKHTLSPGKRSIAIFFILVCIFCLPTITGTALAAGEINLTSAVSSAQKYPDISGDLITWDDLRDGSGNLDGPIPDWVNAEIYMMDRAAVPMISAKNISNESSYNQFLPSSWGSMTVWQDERNSATSGSDIYIKADASIDPIALNTVSENQTVPQISGYYVVWQDLRYRSVGTPFESDVFLYDLTVDTDQDSIPNYLEASKPSPDPAEFRLTPAVTQQNTPAIYGNNVVWQDRRNGYEIFLYDLSIDTDNDTIPNFREEVKPFPDAAEFRLSQGSNFKSGPVVSDRYVAWVENIPNGTGSTDINIVLYDLKVDTDNDTIPNYKEATRPNPDPAMKKISGASLSNLKFSLDVSLNNVVWEEFTDWVSCGTECTTIYSDILTYNASSDTTAHIVQDAFDQSNPAVSGNKVVWDDKRTLDWDIWMKDLDPNAPTGKILINSGAATTDSSTVTVSNLISGNGLLMRFSVDGELTWSSWDPFTASKDLTLPALSGPQIVASQFKDPSGRTLIAYDSIKRDTILGPPVIQTTLVTSPASPDGDNGWIKSAGTATLTRNLSGTTYYAWNSSIGPFLTYSSAIPLLSGQNTLYFYSVDGVTASVEPLQSATIKQDSLAPTDPTSVSSSSHTVSITSTNPRITVDFSGANDGNSGVDGFSYSFTSGEASSMDVPDNVKDAEESANSVTSASLDSGNHYFHIRTKDNAGNWTSTVHLGPFILDTTLIVTTITPSPATPDGENGWIKSAATATLTRSKAGTSYYAWNSSIGPFLTYSGPISVPAGENTLYYYSVDSATSYIEPLKSSAFKQDSLAPTDPTSVSSSSHTVSVTSTNPRITVNFSSASDNASGVDGFSYSFTSGAASSMDVPDATKDIEESATSVMSASLDSGNYYFHIRTKDNAGNWTSTVHLGPFIVDVKAPGILITSGPSGTISTRDATFTWTASDDMTAQGSILYSYSLASFDSGYSTYDSSITKTYIGLANGNYTFNVRAKDSAGNIAATQRVFTVSVNTSTKTRYEETQGVVYSATCWSDYSHASASGGKVKLSKKKNCTASFTYTGTKVEFISAKLNQLGKANVYIDNVLQTSLDLYSSSLLAQQVVFTKTTASSETHTIKIEVSAIKNVSSKDYYVPIDAFDVTS